MDDSDVERILRNMEYRYSKYRMELAAKYPRFRQILIRSYLYGTPQEREIKKEEGKRYTWTWKQYIPLTKGIIKEYGEEKE